MTSAPARVAHRLIPQSGPGRVLAASNLVFTLGSGMYLTAGVLYFTEVAHLPAGQVGLGLMVAGLISLALGIMVGHLADRHGARGVYASALLIQAAATAGFVVADDFWSFVAVVSAATGAKAAGVAARSPLIRQHGGDRPQQFRAYLRAVTNVGVSVGALLAGSAVQAGTATAYDLMVWATAALTAASAVFLAFLPPISPSAPRPGRAGSPCTTGPTCCSPCSTASWRSSSRS
ncbi:MFS transporter [Dactylosporangium darangshiense]|uniref:MFS transporter n=1 Tax=Dactylosporangium darangshiense TaxID=579108 RepID=UPI00363230AD